MNTNPELPDDEIMKEDIPQEAPREDGKTGETETYVGSHADNYDPENTPDPDGPRDEPSGENTKNKGEHGGGLWTSGGQVTTGSGYNEPGS